ncbi:MAG: hypothetical protein PHH67_09820 [Methanosarcina sp.]|nr:hypothetical protein [Methanosarcina sp.]MDD4306781.1 hypothetical protein [Methanosarcina sp.]MDD4621594.1 hypothetical protein [Methanosarcina sp.]
MKGRSIVPGPTDEFSDSVYFNEIEIGSLNDYIPTETHDSDLTTITIPVHPSLFYHGANTIKIRAGNFQDSSHSGIIF